jgi:hypothetical protein
MRAEPERRTVAYVACLARLVAESWLQTQGLGPIREASH